jgi:hypothetical protein
MELKNKVALITGATADRSSYITGATIAVDADRTAI